MPIFERSTYLLTSDSDFQWSLSGFDSGTLFDTLVNKKQSVLIGGKQPEQPKVSMGFGLKKKSTEAVIGQVNQQLSFELEQGALADELLKQFKNAHNKRLLKQSYCFFIGLGSLKKDRLSRPILCIPVHLINDPSLELPFKLEWSGNLPFIHSEVETWLAEKDITLGTLPDALQDLSVSNLFHDLTYKLGSDSGLIFTDQIEIQGVQLKNKTAEPALPLFNPDKRLQTYQNEFTHTHIFSGDALQKAYQISKTPGIYRAEFQQEDLIPFSVSMANHLSLEKPVFIASSNQSYLRKIKSATTDFPPVIPFFELNDTDSLLDVLSEVFEKSPETEAIQEPVLALSEITEKLEAYHQALNHKSSDDIASPAEIMVYLLKSTITSSYKADDADLEFISEAVINQRKQLIRQILKLKSQLSPHEIWDKAEPSMKLEELLDELQKIAQKLKQAHQRIAQLSEKAYELMGIHLKTDPKELENFLHKISFLENIPQFERHQLDQNWHPVPEVIEKAFDQINLVKDLVEELQRDLHIEVLNEHLEALLPEMEKSMDSSKRYIDWNYRKHTKRLVAYSKHANQKFDHSYLPKLRDAIKVQGQLAILNEYGKSVAKYFGSYWQGMGTDIPFLKNQMGWLEAFSKFKLEYINEDIDHLKRLILRKDTQRAVRTITELRQSLLETNEIENTISELLGISIEIISPILHRPDTDIQELFDELAESSHIYKQRIMLSKLQSSEQAKKVARFIQHVLNTKSLIEEAPDRYEHALMLALLSKMEEERGILKYLETGDIRKMTEFIQDSYQDLCEFGRFKKTAHSIQLRKQPAIRKKLKEQINHLKQLKDSQRPLHFYATFLQFKDVLQSIQPLFICNQEQLAELLPLFDAHVLSTETGAIPTDFKNTWIQMELNHEHGHPAKSQKLILDKNQQLKGDFTTESITSLLEKSDKMLTCRIFETEKAELAYWHKITHSAIDFNQWTKAINDGLIHCFTCNETDLSSTSLPYFDFVRVDFTYIDPKSNPFALKKNSVKVLTETGEKLSALGNTIEIHQNENEKSDDTLLKVKTIEEKLSWKLNPDSLLSRQLHTATFLVANPVISDTHSELSGFIRSLDGRYCQIWSDILPSHSSLFETFHNSLTFDSNIYNPLRKLFKKSDSLLLDAVNFVKNEASVKKSKTLPAKTERAAEQLVTLKVSPTKEESAPTSVIISTKDMFSFPEIPQEFQFKQINNPEKSVKPKLNKLPRIKEFTPYQISNLGEPDQFFTTSARSLKKVILEILKSESPIHLHRLSRLLIACWQIERLNENALLITKKLISELAENEELGVKDGVIYQSSDLRFTIRSRENIQEDINAEEIPIVELEIALFLVMDQYHPIKLNDLLNASSHLLGFKELTQPIETVFKRALIKMGMEDVVCVSDGGFQLTRPVLI